MARGLFAADYIAALDGRSVIPGGWINQHYIQLAYQLALAVIGFGYSFSVSCLILYIMGWIPGLSLRVERQEENDGIDLAEFRETAYDFLELGRAVPDRPIPVSHSVGMMDGINQKIGNPISTVRT